MLIKNKNFWNFKLRLQQLESSPNFNLTLSPGDTQVWVSTTHRSKSPGDNPITPNLNSNLHSPPGNTWVWVGTTHRSKFPRGKSNPSSNLFTPGNTQMWVCTTHRSKSPRGNPITLNLNSNLHSPPRKYLGVGLHHAPIEIPERQI